MSKFPIIHNGAKPEIKDNKVTFTYITSLGEIVTEFKNLFEPEEIVNKIRERMVRFKSAGPGSRESESSRAERKYISAHPEEILKETWEILNDDEKMEMIMMLDMNSHYGISSLSWAKKNAEEREYIVGDDVKDLM